jgi:hypothetical protein
MITNAVFPDGVQILGFAPIQLNMVSPKTNSLNQLEYFVNEGLLQGPVDPDTIFTWAGIADETRPLEHRVRSYFAVHCGNCHWLVGVAEKQSWIYGNHLMDYFSADKEINYINEEVTQPFFPDIYMGDDSSGLAIYDYHMGYCIHGQYPDSSVFILLMKSATMPVLGVMQPDTVAIRILSDWIMTIDEPVGIAEEPVRPEIQEYAVFRNRLLHVYGRNVNGRVRLFDVRGNAVPLRRLTKGVYAIERGLSTGVYMVDLGGKSVRLLHF